MIKINCLTQCLNCSLYVYENKVFYTLVYYYLYIYNINIVFTLYLILLLFHIYLMDSLDSTLDTLIFS